MYRIVILSALYLATSFAMAVPPNEKPLDARKIPGEPTWDGWSGYWECVGEQGLGKPNYKGVVTIQKESKVYIVRYSVGGMTYSGVGRVIDGKMTVGWSQGDSSGLTVYAKVDGNVIGEYVAIMPFPGGGTGYMGPHKESLSLLKKLGRE